MDARRIKQNLKRNGPLNVKSIKQSGEPEKKWIAEREKYKQSSEPEKKWIAERKNYQAEPEKKRVAKRQRYCKSSEPAWLLG